MPDWLSEGRVWGVTCQLYGLRSARNLGIGDFEDLAQLAELAAGAGADFIGVNPLHALFYADAGRYSPYAPSSRLFLNPFYIAVDHFRRRGGMDAGPGRGAARRASSSTTSKWRGSNATPSSGLIAAFLRGRPGGGGAVRGLL